MVKQCGRNRSNPKKVLTGFYSEFSGENIASPPYEVECDLADDPLPVFRSLQKKRQRDFVRPLVLKPDDPDLPMLVSSSFPFPVDQICITRFTCRIEKLGTLAPSETCGQFIQSFTGHSMVVLAPAGFIKKYGIDRYKTFVEFSMALPY